MPVVVADGGRRRVDRWPSCERWSRSGSGARRRPPGSSRSSELPRSQRQARSRRGRTAVRRQRTGRHSRCCYDSLCDESEQATDAADGPPTAQRSASEGGAAGPARRDAAVKPATASDWIAGARLRTLPLAIAPVLIGVGAAKVADGPGIWHPVRALLCLAVAVLPPDRRQLRQRLLRRRPRHGRSSASGPSRLTGSGKAAPRAVLTVALVFFALGGGRRASSS